MRLRVLWARVRALVASERRDAELDTEIQQHLEHLAAEHVRRGMTPDEAAQAARRDFGGLQQMKERYRAQRGIGWADDIWRDVAFAGRMLRATPGFTAVALLTLALGIGANTAIFSVVNGLLLKPLPVRDPHQLATVSSDVAISRGFRSGIGWNSAMWEEFRRRAEAFEGVFAVLPQRLDLAQRGEMQPVNGMFVSGDFFRTLGVTAHVGRTFTSADDVRGGGPDGPVAVISHGLWQRRFGGAADIVGTPIVVEGASVSIVGVTPPEFFGIEPGQSFDLAMPLSTEALVHGARAVIDEPRAMALLIMLRLKPGQSLAAGTAAMRAVQPDVLRTMAEVPPFVKEPFTLTAAATGTADRLRQRYQLPLVTISIVVALVLLIACANLANLLLARGTARRHDLSIRRALGASSWRLARQTLIESALLSAAGAFAGLVCARWASRALIAQLTTTDNRVLLDLSLDWRVLGFTTAVAGATTLLFGAAPVVNAWRVTPMETLKASGAGFRSSAHRPRWAGGLVVAQVSLSLILVIAAGLFARTLDRLTRVSLGFDQGEVLLATVETARARIDPDSRTGFYHRLVAAVGQVPGVTAAAGSIWTPGGGGGAGLIRDARGRSVDPARQIVANFITPGWFAVYGMRIREGRDLRDGDVAAGEPVVVVNETFARTFLSGRRALGTHLDDDALTRMLEGRTVIGVVSDALYGSLRDGVPPTIYLPLAQSEGLGPPTSSDVIISIRAAAGAPGSLAPAVSAELSRVDPDLAFSFRPLEDQVAALLAQERLLARLSGALATVALLLAATGLYGITAYRATQRRTELGIRIALGARRGHVIGVVIGRSLGLVTIGIVAGLAGAAVVTQSVESLLFGVTPLDATTFVLVTAVFVAVTTLAAYLPARRATTVDPVAALRYQ